MKILCYGDSNTYGYDPRDPFGGRYEADERWPELLAGKTGHTVVNAGMNGREIPRTFTALRALCRLVEEETPDLLAVLLGTNDVLNGATPEEASAAMGMFIAALRERFPELTVLLIAPVPFAIPGYAQSECSRQLSAVYRALAKKEGLLFADAGQWNIPLGYDGIHFTADGHRIFADRLADCLP